MRSYQSTNFFRDVKNFNLKITDINFKSIKDIETAFGIKLNDASSKIKLANFINIITILANHKNYDTTHINDIILPSRTFLIDYLEYTFKVTPDNANSLINFCIHNLKEQPSLYKQLENTSTVLRPANTDKIYKIIKDEMAPNQQSEIIEDTTIDAYFRNTLNDTEMCKKIKETLIEFSDPSFSFYEIGNTNNINFMGNPVKDLSNLKDRFTKIQSYVKKHLEKIKRDDKDSKTLINTKNKKRIFNHMKDLDAIVTYSLSAAGVNKYPTQEIAQKKINTQYRQQSNLMDLWKNCLAKGIANCEELAEILYIKVYADPSISTEIKKQLKVVNFSSPDDHGCLLIGDINDDNSIVIDPWIRYLDLTAKDGFRNETVYSSSRDVGFMGTKKQYMEFIATHEDGEYLKQKGSHTLTEWSPFKTFLSENKNNLYNMDFILLKGCTQIDEIIDKDPFLLTHCSNEQIVNYLKTKSTEELSKLIQITDQNGIILATLIAQNANDTVKELLLKKIHENSLSNLLEKTDTNGMNLAVLIAKGANNTVKELLLETIRDNQLSPLLRSEMNGTSLAMLIVWRANDTVKKLLLTMYYNDIDSKSNYELNKTDQNDTSLAMFIAEGANDAIKELLLTTIRDNSLSDLLDKTNNNKISLAVLITQRAADTTKKSLLTIISDNKLSHLLDKTNNNKISLAVLIAQGASDTIKELLLTIIQKSDMNYLLEKTDTNGISLAVLIAQGANDTVKKLLETIKT